MADSNKRAPRRVDVDETQPKYRRLPRIEARLWPEQRDDLTELARDLQDARTSKGERITANTLVRVGVDLLLAHQDALVGNTEEELRQSVLPESGTE